MEVRINEHCWNHSIDRRGASGAPPVYVFCFSPMPGELGLEE